MFSKVFALFMIASVVLAMPSAEPQIEIDGMPITDEQPVFWKKE